LASHIERVQHLLDTQRTWTPQQWAPIQFLLASALVSIGEQSGDNKYLKQSISAYRAALLEWTRDRVPLDWAMTQNNLGNALLTLGERESGTARLEEAVSAYRDALLERTRDRVPLQWAMTQNNLDTALSTLGERESGMARLEEAVSTGTRCSSTRAIAFRCSGRRPKTIWAPRYGGSVSASRGRRAWKRP
jgi:tetratricopeptide (TPR) repeat protein